MDEDEEYEFKIDAYSPETIPMERLALYLVDLAKLLANQDRVHFQRLEGGSTKVVARVEREAAPKVAKRIEDVNRGLAANDAVSSFKNLNELLRLDNAVGLLCRRAPKGDPRPTTLKFLGREAPPPVKMGPFTEPATVDGELVRIGGKDHTAHAQILDPEGKTWSGELTRELAQQLAQHIYKGPILRVHGEARWERGEDESWHLISFKIVGFKTLEGDTLDAVAKRLRSLKETDWSKLDDLNGEIRASRSDGDGLH